MKKVYTLLLTVFTACVLLLAGCSKDSDEQITADGLPYQAQVLITSYFSDSQLVEIVKSKGSYTVKLSDTTTLQLDEKGEWISLTSVNGIKQSRLAILPSSVLATLAQEPYGNLQVKQVVQRTYSFEVELRGRGIDVSLVVDKDGNVWSDKVADNTVRVGYTSLPSYARSIIDTHYPNQYDYTRYDGAEYRRLNVYLIDGTRLEFCEYGFAFKGVEVVEGRRISESMQLYPDVRAYVKNAYPGRVVKSYIRGDSELGCRLVLFGEPTVELFFSNAGELLGKNVY